MSSEIMTTEIQDGTAVLRLDDGKANALQSKLDRTQQAIKSTKGQRTAAIESAQLILKEIQEDEELQKKALTDYDKALGMGVVCDFTCCAMFFDVAYLV